MTIYPDDNKADISASEDESEPEPTVVGDAAEKDDATKGGNDNGDDHKGDDSEGDDDNSGRIFCYI